MENTPKFRLRLNLFDGIVLVLALCVGGLLLWMAMKPSAGSQSASSTASTVRYTVRFQRWPEGTSSIIEAGDKVMDNIKNYEMGTVVSYETVPAVYQVLDSVNHRYVQADIEGYEDILVTIESPCTESDQGFLLGGGYELRVGVTTYIKGEGYMASGPVVSVEREGQA